MKNIIQIILSFKKAIRFIILAIILISFGIFWKPGSFILPNGSTGLQNDATGPRGVIVALVRSKNKSIFLAVNMINSVIKFHSTNRTHLYPFLLFHDQNFTSSMREQILSCIHKYNKKIQISFAFINFKTKVKIDKGTSEYKTIGYRMMCRFWTYDVFYHPAIKQGQYDYLMRMDDDSYFSDGTGKDLFLYMNNKKLDYLYRSYYGESTPAMDPIFKRHTNGTRFGGLCIYNNFCIMRLKWWYESKRIQSFVHDLIQKDLMLRQYIGDGCAHAAMLKIDNKVKAEHITDVPYGHNAHIMPAGQPGWGFHPVDGFHDDAHNFCHELRVLQGPHAKLTRINLF
jgi:hypothetical protein